MMIVVYFLHINFKHFSFQSLKFKQIENGEKTIFTKSKEIFQAKNNKNLRHILRTNKATRDGVMEKEILDTRIEEGLETEVSSAHIIYKNPGNLNTVHPPIYGFFMAQKFVHKAGFVFKSDESPQITVLGYSPFLSLNPFFRDYLSDEFSGPCTLWTSLFSGYLIANL